MSSESSIQSQYTGIIAYMSAQLAQYQRVMAAIIGGNTNTSNTTLVSGTTGISNSALPAEVQDFVNGLYSNSYYSCTGTQDYNIIDSDTNCILTPEPECPPTVCPEPECPPADPPVEEHDYSISRRGLMKDLAGIYKQASGKKLGKNISEAELATMISYLEQKGTMPDYLDMLKDMKDNFTEVAGLRGRKDGINAKDLKRLAKTNVAEGETRNIITINDINSL